MIELWRDQHETWERTSSTNLAESWPTLSSAHAGWEGLSVQVFDEPDELESLHVPSTGDLTLGMYLGGTIHVERREGQGSWHGGDMYSGDLFLNWGNRPAYEARTWSLSSVPTQVLNLSVSQEVVARAAQEELGVDLARLEVGGRTGFRDPLVAQIALTLWRELEQPAPAGNLYAQSAAQFLAVHVLRHYTSSWERLRARPLPPHKLTERQVRQLLEFIQAHLDEQLSLETLARQVGFSPHHFAQLFRRATGTSPHQFILRQRLERAQGLLQGTELPLAQIASACGFAHQSHLTQVFKRHLNRTPGAYRQDGSRCARL
ncbi:MAG TPA: AraC family transcriptional regulator [Ktedonobacterales bacterium]|jgi:AraC family transcriptional regulator